MNQFINNPDYNRANNIYEFTVRNLQNELVKLDIYKGFVCIIVNTATKSPFTDYHYKQFNELMDKYADSKGLRIAAFPCNQFGLEEPGTAEDIAAHAQKYNVKFDIYAKVDVNGKTACDLWKFLKLRHAAKSKTGDVIKSSYTKFVISKAGVPVERYGPEIEPAQFETLLEPYWG